MLAETIGSVILRSPCHLLAVHELVHWRWVCFGKFLRWKEWSWNDRTRHIPSKAVKFILPAISPVSVPLTVRYPQNVSCMMKRSYRCRLTTGCISKTRTVPFTEVNMSLFVGSMEDNECSKTWRYLHQVSSFESKHPLYFPYFWISLNFNVVNCLHLKYSCELGAPSSVRIADLTCEYCITQYHSNTIIEENLH